MCKKLKTEKLEPRVFLSVVATLEYSVMSLVTISHASPSLGARYGAVDKYLLPKKISAV